MWNRTDIKAQGKASFKRNYWKSVLVAFIYSLFFTASGTASSSHREELSTTLNNQLNEDPDMIAFLLIILAIVGVIMCVLVLVDIFVLNPLEVGCNRFFLINQDNNSELNELGHAFKNNYFGVVVGILLRSILIVLGTILFVIPGLILAYSYRMVPYILAEDSSIGAVDALKKSRLMMKGHKWSTFVYDLSFILWYILGAITCGIVALFYVNPYKQNADAALYKAISAGYNQQ